MISVRNVIISDARKLAGKHRGLFFIHAAEIKAYKRIRRRVIVNLQIQFNTVGILGDRDRAHLRDILIHAVSFDRSDLRLEAVHLHLVMIQIQQIHAAGSADINVLILRDIIPGITRDAAGKTCLGIQERIILHLPLTHECRVIADVNARSAKHEELSLLIHGDVEIVVVRHPYLSDRKVWIQITDSAASHHKITFRLLIRGNS